MSGPKIDYAELERREKERQQKEYLERLRRIKEETDKYSAISSSIRGQLRLFLNYGNDVIIQAGKYEGSEYNIKQISQKKAECERKVSILLQSKLPSIPEEIALHNEKTHREAETILYEYKCSIDNSINELKDLVLAKEQIEKADTFFSDINSEDKQIIINDPAVFCMVVDKSSNSTEIKEEIKSIFESISGLLSCGALTKKDKIIALKCLNGLCDLLAEEVDDNLVNAKLSQYRRAFAELSKNSKEAEDAYSEYVASYVAFTEVSSQENILLRTIDGFNSVEEIYEETKKLNDIAIRIKNEDYIREQISEVMKMFGYDNCVDLNFQNKKGTDFEFLNSDSSLGVHVYISDSTEGSQQQIMMEITDYQYDENCNGPQIDVDNLSEDDISDILEKQGQFCRMHPEIVAELRKRGVILSEKKHHPVSRQHSKRIINSERPEKVKKDRLLYREVAKKRKKQYMKKK